MLQCNQYISEQEPWKLAKSDSPSDRERVPTVIYTAVEVLRIAGILLQPFMPSKAPQLLETLAVDEQRRTFADAVFGADATYGRLVVRLWRPGTNEPDLWHLFPPLAVED